jgi:hypothetical protein
MRKLILVQFFALYAVLSANAQHDTTLIKACFAGYKNAILSDKGSEAVGFVDSRTVKYYADILQKTKTLDSIGVDKLPIMDKLTILMLRYRATKEEIMKLDGKSLLEFAIGRGMVGKSSVQQISLGEVKITGDSASAQVMVGENATPLSYKFYKEESAWKMDITCVLPEGNKALKQVIKDSGQPENEFLEMVIGNVTGAEPLNDIWKPMLN